MSLPQVLNVQNWPTGRVPLLRSSLAPHYADLKVGT